jgi:hydroxymethylpyrimidine/phosphomethylpyrimidine kinase
MTRKQQKTNDNSCKRVLVIAESDPGGAAGIQGDIKTILALGGYATTAISYLAAPPDKDIIPSNYIDPFFVGRQMRAALEGGNTDAIKIGSIDNEKVIDVVADILDEHRDRKIPVVIDPSIVSRSGAVLVDDKAIAAWKRRLYIHAKILTPNLQEAELLGVMKIQDTDDMRHAADMMRSLGVENVALKGGQVELGKELYFIASQDEERIYERPTIETPHTLGAGSAFSSALALNMAKGMDVFMATEHALDFMHQAILHSSGFGDAAGPINHAFDIVQRPSVFHPEAIKIYKV